MFLEKLWLIELIIAAILGVLALLWHWRRPKSGQPGRMNIFLLLSAFLLTAAIASFFGGVFDRWVGTSPTCTVAGTLVAVVAEIRIALRGLIRGDNIDVDDLTR